MTDAEVMEAARDAIFATALISSPSMVVGVLVGVAVSLFQGMTQIQEMTLVYVPENHRGVLSVADCLAFHG